MAQELMRSSQSKSRAHLDPRTKILLLITVCLIVLGGLGGSKLYYFRLVLSLLPFILLAVSGKIKTAGICLLVYAASAAVNEWFLQSAIGFGSIIVVAMQIICLQLLPNIVTGYYVVSSTTVSEFMSAMERMHVTEKLVIPMSVMFRFFPTVSEESHAINDAMRMRGIRFGGGKPMKMLEYRVVPMMMCSVKIGEELSAAALTRGLGAPVRRTNICRIGFRLLDFIVIAFIVLCYVLILLEYAGILRG